MLDTLEKFTQTAYLQTAAVKADSQIFESEEVAYIRTHSSKERWMNSVVRMAYVPRDFGKVERVIELFDSAKINFNWHCWPSSHPQLLPFLTQSIGMHRLGALDFVHKPVGISRSAADPFGFELLSKKNLDAYVDAKMAGWNNAPAWRPEILHATRVAMKDPRQKIILFVFESQIVGAVGSFQDAETAYLRGDFVVPAFRGRGFYSRLIAYREKVLGDCGIKTMTVLADQDTSSPIYQKLGYVKTAEIALLSRQTSQWVSL